MPEDILINFTPQETRVAVMYQGAVQELHIERNASRGLVGNVYVGRIVRILPGMQSAFVDVGLERTAFLHIADIWEAKQNGAGEVVPEGGETATAVFDRVRTAIDRLCTDHPGQRVCVVTHGLALFHVFSYVCGLGVPRPDASVFVLVDNASITHVQHRAGDRWRIMTINDTAHLRGL